MAVDSVRTFFDYAAAFTHDELRFRPWGKISASTLSGLPNTGSSQNKTPVIPDRVFAPLLEGALFLVESGPPHIFGAATAPVRHDFPPSRRGGVSADFDRRLDELVDNAGRQGRGLPAARKPTKKNQGISVLAIAQSIGMKDHMYLYRPDRWEKITAAAQRLGLGWKSLDPVSQVEIRGPSRAEFTPDPSTLENARRVALTACLVVVAALSGMRTSELAALERAAYFTEDSGLGLVRHRVRSLLLKGQPPGGRRGTWTVIEQVAQALKAAESLTDSEHPLSVAGFEDQYRALRKWINTAGREAGLRPVPEDWQVSLRQFRKTLARELAWRPNGIIAAKIHLKHISVATTEGYAGGRGESSSTFLKEVEKEQFEAREQAVREVISAIERGEQVAGLGAKELRAAVASLPGEGGEGPQTRERDDAVVALIASRAEIFYPMPLAHCWFTDPLRARCLRGVADKSRPIGASCQPAKCVNATIHPEHAGVWLAGMDELSASIRTRRIAAGECERVNLKIASFRSVVEDLGLSDT
ncbi:hypothetical protein [Sinomonas sp. RB5]